MLSGGWASDMISCNLFCMGTYTISTAWLIRLGRPSNVCELAHLIFWKRWCLTSWAERKTKCPWKISNCQCVYVCLSITSLSVWHDDVIKLGTFSALLTICVGNSPVIGEFTAQRPVTQSFDVFIELRLNKRLSKRSWGWWFETLSRPLWRHCYDNSRQKMQNSLVKIPIVLGVDSPWPSRSN